MVFAEKTNEIYTFRRLILSSWFSFSGMTLARYLAAVTLIRNEIIVPIILIVGLIGSYAIRNMMEDVMISLVFGILGYVMLKGGFTTVPLLLGLVLGEMVELNYHRALLMSAGSYSIFYSSTVCKILILLTIVSLAGPYLGSLRRRIKGRGRIKGKA
jgi:putative tricarboxylic transport membrane protein